MNARIPTSSAAVNAGRPRLALELLGFVLGAATFAIDPLSFIHPQLALAAFAWCLLAMLLTRFLPPFRSRPLAGHWAGVAALVVYVGLLTASTGATSSPFLPLYGLPVIATALVSRAPQVMGLTVGVAALALVQSGLLDAMNDMFLLTTAAIIANVLAPSAAAALVIASVRGRLDRVVEKVETLRATDPLTGLMTLEAWEALADEQQQAVERTGQSYSVLVVDVDDLRRLNESHGHDAGSRMIAAVAQAVVRSIRSSDHAARMGGDVFVVLLAGADQATALQVAQRVRNNVHNGTLQVGDSLLRATVSIGMATCPRDERSPKALLILADQRLQQDKALRRPAAR